MAVCRGPLGFSGALELLNLTLGSPYLELSYSGPRKQGPHSRRPQPHFDSPGNAGRLERATARQRMSEWPRCKGLAGSNWDASLLLVLGQTAALQRALLFCRRNVGAGWDALYQPSVPVIGWASCSIPGPSGQGPLRDRRQQGALRMCTWERRRELSVLTVSLTARVWPELHKKEGLSS